MAEDTAPNVLNETVETPSNVKVLRLNYDDFYRSGGIVINLFESTDDSYTEIFPRKEILKEADLSVTTKKNKENIVNDNWYELAGGYDVCDPFIDNGEAYNDIVDGVNTELGGFFLNKGLLEMKNDSNIKFDSPKKSKKSHKKVSFQGDEENVADPERKAEKKVRKRKKPVEAVIVAVSAEEVKTGDNSKQDTLLDSKNSVDIFEGFSEEEKALLVETGNLLSTKSLDEITPEVILQFSLIVLRISRKSRVAIIKEIFKNVSHPRNMVYQLCEIQLMAYFSDKIDKFIDVLVSDVTAIKSITWIMSRYEFSQFCEHLEQIHKVTRVFAKGTDKKELALQHGKKISVLCPVSVPLKEFYLTMYSEALTTAKKARQIQQIKFLAYLALQNGATTEEISSIEEKNSKVAVQNSPIKPKVVLNEGNERIKKTEDTLLVERTDLCRVADSISIEIKNEASNPDTINKNDIVTPLASLNSGVSWDKFALSLKERDCKNPDNFTKEMHASDHGEFLDKVKDMSKNTVLGPLSNRGNERDQIGVQNKPFESVPDYLPSTIIKGEKMITNPVKFNESYHIKQQEHIWHPHSDTTTYLKPENNIPLNIPANSFKNNNNIRAISSNILQNKQTVNNSVYSLRINTGNVQFQRPTIQEFNSSIDNSQRQTSNYNSNYYRHPYYPGTMNPSVRNPEIDYQMQNVWNSNNQTQNPAMVQRFYNYMYKGPDT